MPLNLAIAQIRPGTTCPSGATTWRLPEWPADLSAEAEGCQTEKRPAPRAGAGARARRRGRRGGRAAKPTGECKAREESGAETGSQRETWSGVATQSRSGLKAGRRSRHDGRCVCVWAGARSSRPSRGPAGGRLSGSSSVPTCNTVCARLVRQAVATERAC
ncbi:Protein of unknown function [Gryllus bimaculatus]|nr:Protein of unknown function [Gryllus bimaculatus]